MSRALLGLCCVVALAVPAPAVWADAAHRDHAHAHDHASAHEQMPWGIAGDPGKATRTIVIRMTDDMRFTPDKLEVRQGETVKFELRNDGKVLHEFVLGTAATHADLYAEILKAPDMHHEAAYMAHVDPGEAGPVVWQFNRAGTFEYACLLPGHYPAGMRGVIEVSSAGASESPAAQTYMADGEVLKVDHKTRRITLKHGDLPQLGMGPMTMAFRVQDATMLDRVKPGDKIRFNAARVGGAATITAMESAD